MARDLHKYAAMVQASQGIENKPLRDRSQEPVRWWERIVQWTLAVALVLWWLLMFVAVGLLSLWVGSKVVHFFSG